MVKRTITITTILLILSIAISLIIVLNKASFAAEDIASGTSGTCSWVIDSEGVLTISPTDGVSGTLEYYITYSSDKYGYKWHDYHDSILRVIVEPGVKMASQCTGLFNDLDKCVSMDLSGLDTSEAVNMKFMFYDCASLINLDVSSFDTSNVTDLGSMFAHCSSLTSIDVSNFNTSKVTYAGGIFSGCTNLTSVDLSNWDTSNVYSFSSLFYHCTGLTSINMDYLDVSKISDMSHMFEMCTSLTTFNPKGWSIESLSDMSEMFARCTNLTDVSVIESWDVSKVTDIGGTFYQCESLESLDLSSWDTSKVSNTVGFVWLKSEGNSVTYSNAGTFQGCTSLTSLNLSNWNLSKVTDAERLFKGCSSLKKLDLSTWSEWSPITLSGMFSECFNLEELDISTLNTTERTTKMYDFFGQLSYVNKIRKLTLGPNFSFKGKNIDNSYYWALLPSLSSASPYTGKWIREDGAYGPYSSGDFYNNYDGSIMAGTWVWEKNTNDYIVSYSYVGTIPDGASDLPVNETHKSGEWVEVAEAATAPGYTFSGWSYSNFTMPSYNVEITGQFTANRDTPYRVEHFLEDESLGTYTLKETERLTGTTDTTKRGTPKTYAGYTFDSSIEGTIREGTIKGDGSLVLKLYYRKNEVPVENNHKYKVQYFFDGIIDDSLEEIINEEIDSEVNITPITPIKHGEKNYTLVSNNHKITISVNDDDNIIRVYYETDVLDYAIDGDVTEGDGIPDKYQISITYKVENGNWNDGTKGTKTDVITLKDKDGNLSEEGTGTTTIPEVGNKPSEGYTKGYWNKVIPNKVSSKDDGKEFVYSYEVIDKVKSDISGGKGKSSNPKTDDIVNKYLLVGVGGLLVLALVSKIRRKYSRKAKKVQF